MGRRQALGLPAQYQRHRTASAHAPSPLTTTTPTIPSITETTGTSLVDHWRITAQPQQAPTPHSDIGAAIGVQIAIAALFGLDAWPTTMDPERRRFISNRRCVLSPERVLKNQNTCCQSKQMTEGNCLVLLNQLEDMLDSDPLIDEVGFIHPSQFVTLNEEAGGPLLSSVGTTHQSKDGVLGLRVSKVNSSEMVFWCRDHKLGISTQVLLPLYGAAKHAFMAALERYKTHSNISVNKDASGRNMSICLSSSLDIFESDVMKHSRALLLLSCDFGTAWNARKFVLSGKQHFHIFVEELLLSTLVLSYAPKSERPWSHRRWVIKTIARKCSNLQEIVEKESELVKKIAEKSKMNYRAWNHCCWLVSYISGG